MEQSARRRETIARDAIYSRGIKASRTPGIRAKAREVGMFISVSPNSRQFQQQQPYEQRPSTPEWVLAESPAVTTSVSHNTVGGLSNAASAPTRRISASSTLQSKVAARRVTSKHQRSKVAESRFGNVRKNLSKTVQSLQVLRNDLEQTLANGLKTVQSIATQTNDPDEMAEAENTAATVATIAVGTSKRTSRIPIPCEKPSPREKTPVPGYSGRNSAEPCGNNYALGNVYSLMTASVSETQLEDISSSADLSISVMPVLEAQESCTVLDVDVLRLAEVKSKEVDVDRTLENWKPTTAVVSLVPEAKLKSTSKKSIVKKERSKEDNLKKDDSGKTEVVDLDKEAFQVPVSKSKHSEKRSSRKSSGHETTCDDEKAGEKQKDGARPSGGSSCRVRFSPHLTSPSAPSTAAREKTSNASTNAAISKFPELLKRVTDQAITSIAKTVILGLPQQMAPRYDLHPAASYSNHHSPISSSQSFAGNFRSLPAYSRATPPITMSTLNMNDDSTGGYRFPSRNTSQLSVASLINYPTNGGGGGMGAHLLNRYSYLPPHHRMSSNSSPKTRKELDNRYSLNHQSGHWEAPVPRNSWAHDSSSAYNVHSGEYGSRPGSGNQFWLRYQKMKNHSGGWSTTSSSSSLYTPQKAPKYERPSQRFSLIRNHGGGMRNSLEDLHNSTMNNQTMDTGSSLHQPMGLESEVDNINANTASYNENLYV